MTKPNKSDIYSGVWENRIIRSGTADPKELRKNPDNWRTHPKNQAAALEGVLNEVGWIQDVIVNERTGNMIDGHLRVELAVKHKEPTIPVKYVDLSEEEEKKAILTFDPIGAMAEADKALLDGLMKQVSSDSEAVSEMLDALAKEVGILCPDANEVADDSYEPPAEIETDIHRGDLFRLGRHRLLCGDSTSAEDVARLMGGAKEVSVLTDPPYNIGFKYNAIDDKMPKSEYKAFCEAFFKNIVDAGAKGIIITPGPRNEEFYPKPKDRGIWVKRYATAGASVFHLRLCEPILFYGTFKEKRNTDLFEYSSGFTQELKDAQKKRGVLEEHAPAKPIALWSDLINMLSDGVVLDLFSGNGTTLIACEQLGRTCYGMEISPQYCQVIIDRWEKLTGQKAEKVDA